jgi:hypothetical protein
VCRRGSRQQRRRGCSCGRSGTDTRPCPARPQDFPPEAPEEEEASELKYAPQPDARRPKARVYVQEAALPAVPEPEECSEE